MYENVFHSDQQKKMHFLVNTVQKKGNSVRGKKGRQPNQTRSLGLRNVEIGCVSNKKIAKKQQRKEIKQTST